MLQRKPDVVSLRTALLTQVKTAPSVCIEKSSSVSGYTHSRRPLSSSHRKTLDCCAVPLQKLSLLSSRRFASAGSQKKRKTTG